MQDTPKNTPIKPGNRKSSYPSLVSICTGCTSDDARLVSDDGTASGCRCQEKRMLNGRGKGRG